MGIIIALAWTIYPDPVTGITDTTVENVVLLGGLYLALPCGLTNIIVGIFARSKGLVTKMIAIVGILVGVLGVLIGIVSWGLFIMVSSFVF